MTNNKTNTSALDELRERVKVRLDGAINKVFADIYNEFETDEFIKTGKEITIYGDIEPFTALTLEKHLREIAEIVTEVTATNYEYAMEESENE